MTVELILRLLWAFIKLGLIATLIVWLMARAWKRTEDDRLLSKWILSAAVLAFILFFVIPTVMKMESDPYYAAFVGIPAAAVAGLLLAMLWGSNIGSFIARPLMDIFDGGDVQLEPQPLYSIAEARRKRGRYAEAIAEVHQQLARFPHDVPGHLLLAEIQAENLNNLADARDTVERFIHQPDHAPANVALALNRLADWELKLARDPVAAREAFERIRALFPDTELAQLAAQRIAHLASRDQLEQKANPRPVPLPPMRTGASLADREQLESEQDQAAVDRLVQQLEEYPLDGQAREDLALLYAHRFQRLDLALDQLEQLIAFPQQQPKSVVHWLNLVADLQIKYAQDENAARAALERIIALYPGVAAAEMARSRIPHLPLELKATRQTDVIKLGQYEQNLGLGKGWVREP